MTLTYKTPSCFLYHPHTKWGSNFETLRYQVHNPTPEIIPTPSGEVISRLSAAEPYIFAMSHHPHTKWGSNFETFSETKCSIFYFYHPHTKWGSNFPRSTSPEVECIHNSNLPKSLHFFPRSTSPEVECIHNSNLPKSLHFH